MALKMLKTLPRNYKIPQFTALGHRLISNYNDNEIPEHVKQLREKDQPVEIANPFEKPKAQCILCKHNIKPDYKNVRLLSQFVSPYTGRIYGRHITALCERKHELVEREIKKAIYAGFMAGYLKEPIYFKDPKLYNPENPLKPNSV